jgi:hypothetical protein
MILLRPLVNDPPQASDVRRDAPNLPAVAGRDSLPWPKAALLCERPRPEARKMRWARHIGDSSLRNSTRGADCSFTAFVNRRLIPHLRLPLPRERLDLLPCSENGFCK